MAESTTDFINRWKQEIELGIKYRQKYSSISSWPKFRQYYRGAWDENIVPVNRTFSYIRSLIPRVYFRNPGVSVTALRPEYSWPARVLEATDNYLLSELNLKRHLKKAILDAGLCGIGYLKIGFDSEFGFTPIQAVGENSETITQVGTKEGERIEYNIDVKEGMPWALRTSPEQIITPWGYSDPDSLPWICHEILRPLKDVKEDQKYRNTNDLKGGYQVNLRGKARRKKPEGSDNDFAQLFEIRDLKTGRMYVICEDKLLLDNEDDLQIEGLPYETIIFNPDPEHFHGISDVHILEPQQKELNDIRTQGSRHRRASILKILIGKGLLNEESMEKLRNDEIDAFVECLDEFPHQKISTFQPTSGVDYAREAAIVEEDMKESLGFGRNQSSSLTPAGKTPPSALEVGVVQQAFETRVDERRDIVADVLQRVVRKWNQYIFKHWSKERVAEVVGESGRKYWVQFTGKELEGEYHFRIDPEAGMPITRALKAQQMEALYAKFVNDPLIDQIGLRKMYLKHVEWLDPSVTGLLQTPSLEGIDTQGLPPEMLQMLEQGQGQGQGETIGTPQSPVPMRDLIGKGAS